MGGMVCTEPQCLYKGALYLYLTYMNIYWVFENRITYLVCRLIFI